MFGLCENFEERKSPVCMIFLHEHPAPFTHNFSWDANPEKSLFQQVPGCNGFANLS